MSWQDECFSEIRKGDTVWYQNKQGQTHKGKAVMFGPAGWVVNFNKGMPAVVNEKNFIKLRKGKNRHPDYFGKFLNR